MPVALDNIALRISHDLTAAEIALRKIPNDDPNGAFWDCISAQLKSGDATLLEILDDAGARVGFTVYRVDEFGDWRELVSLATHCGKSAGLRFALDDFLSVLARRERCRSVRMHTARHGLVAESIKAGWHVAEITLRKHI